MAIESVAVFYESWQMECCGEAFRPGDSVHWSVQPGGEQFDQWIAQTGKGRVQWVEDHHDTGTAPHSNIDGTVTALYAIWEILRPESPGDSFHVPVAGTVVALPVDRTLQWEEDEGGSRPSTEHSFRGYLATLQVEAPEGPGMAP